VKGNERGLPAEVMAPERFELWEEPAYRFSVTRRQFLELAGAGLLVVATLEPAQAQREAGAETIQGRLHLGEDGRITVFTGKVEEGQGVRTQLAMAAAEELGVKLDQIRVVTADTDLSPNDWITAGSRSTPTTVPAVRRAAAATRELLGDYAARQWKVSRERVKLENGEAREQGGSRRLRLDDLARSSEAAKAWTDQLPGDIRLVPVGEWRLMGKPQGRTDAQAMVTGAHKFPSDIERPNMLHGSVLRPPALGATLTAVNLEPAKKMPGVVVVRDGEFVACAGSTSYQARKAVQAVAATAQWKEKPGQPSNATLWQYLKASAQTGGGGGRNQGQAKGDVGAALAGAGKKFQATYTAAYVQHAPMEPRAAVAEWQDGKLTVWTGTSNPFSVREQLAKAFGIGQEKVRVIVPDFGGGFGGKHTGEAALEAARLAREAERPVSLRWTRAEEFYWAYCRPAALIEIQAALSPTNGILAWDHVNYNSGASAIASPYRAEHLQTRFIPCDSPIRHGSYRTLAATANNFAREAFLDEMASSAGMDPLEFRLKNLDNPRIAEVLVAAAEKFGWKQRVQKRQPNRGVGLACGTEKNSVVAACAEVEVDPSAGTVRLVEICEAYECGAIINPLNLRSQVEGCILMGLGAVLREEILFENGRLQNARFARYRVPRFRDVPPKMEIVLVDKKDTESAGAGETPIMVVAPAMANAVFAATGKRVRSLPFGKVTAG
jgi:CO/xanthine dehydrogenase Mo-binding subunit